MPFGDFRSPLNAFQGFSTSIPYSHIREHLEECQKSLHAWGHANQVVFDLSKESFHLSHPTEASMSYIEMLGIRFDNQLLSGKMMMAFSILSTKGRAVNKDAH